eukprot:scaffold49858_cov55-Phaeocystis_antarctica.AAC.3
MRAIAATACLTEGGADAGSACRVSQSESCTFRVQAEASHSPAPARRTARGNGRRRDRRGQRSRRVGRAPTTRRRSTGGARGAVWSAATRPVSPGPPACGGARAVGRGGGDDWSGARGARRTLEIGPRMPSEMPSLSQRAAQITTPMVDTG